MRVVDYRDSKLHEYYEDAALVDKYIYSYSSNKSRVVVPVQDWLRKLTAEDPQYWQRATEKAVAREQFATNRFETYLKNLNRTEGFHLAVWSSGCELNDETDEIRGWYAEDLGFADVPFRHWTLAKDQGDHVKLIWEDNKPPPVTLKFYTEECPSVLRMFVSILTRTELPKVSLLQETPSSPVSCNATGFYPDKAVLFWRKDGEKLHEGVKHGEMLQDGTFQMSVDLNVMANMDGKYECVFQLTGVKEDIVTVLVIRSILSNASGEDLNTTTSGNTSQATSWPTTITVRPTTSGTSNGNQTTTWLNTTMEATTRPSLNNSEATRPTPGHKKSSVNVAVATVGVIAAAVLLSAIIFWIVKRHRRTHTTYWDTVIVRFTRSGSE
ncbi:H-2 class I histocompatibility antigen, alpha chain-like [Nerophis ophidion]|uniref:H-2 class I histocompatibility antigen, alpha chain-like n=1 Tax=Nerophis ophidion TaxID=159077 RepID=UPI002ADF610D|nr:H-2 class I histocompatibility antigen, alpha chain-like [Nerophis ophidion]